MFGALQQLDITLFFFINHDFQNRLFDVIMPFITTRAYLLVLLVLFFCFFKNRSMVVILSLVSFASLLIADGVSHMLKDLFVRERPCNALQGVHLLVGCTESFSLPSNHASNASAFAVSFMVLTRKWIAGILSGREGSTLPETQQGLLRFVISAGYFFIFLALLVAFSRVYVGVHYPSDVVAGAAVGVLVSISLVALYRWAEGRFIEKPFMTVMSLFLIGVSLFRIHYILYGPLDLSPDEAHYWEWSRRLDMSYYSKGPMIAYLIALGTSLFGDTVFGVRFLAVVFSFLSSLLIYKLGKEMYSEAVGSFSAILIQVIPLFSAFGVIFSIDAPFIFFWVLSLFLFYKAAQKTTISAQGTEHTSLKYWVLLGLSIGLGLLTKYTMVFFYLCAVCFLFSSKDHRVLLKTASPYITLLISLVLFSPVIFWNMEHGWVTVMHTAGQAHIGEGLQISLRSFFEFIGSQFAVLSPVVAVMIVMALVRSRSSERGSFLLCFSFPLLLFFALKSIQGKVQANWAMTGYVTGIIAFSAVYLAVWEKQKKSDRIIISTGLALAVIFSVVAHYPAKLGVPIKYDSSARLRGWKELGREVEKVSSTMTHEKGVFIFSDKYQVSSELAFYTKGHPATYCVNLGRRMNQYDLWPQFHNMIHHNAIFVTIGSGALPREIGDAFENCTGQPFSVYQGKKVLREYSIFACNDFRGMKQERITNY